MWRNTLPWLMIRKWCINKLDWKIQDMTLGPQLVRNSFRPTVWHCVKKCVDVSKKWVMIELWIEQNNVCHQTAIKQQQTLSSTQLTECFAINNTLNKKLSRDHLICHRPFVIGGPLEPNLYLQPFSKYWGHDINLSWTWCCRSPEHLIPHRQFLIASSDSFSVRRTV